MVRHLTPLRVTANGTTYRYQLLFILHLLSLYFITDFFLLYRYIFHVLLMCSSFQLRALHLLKLSLAQDALHLFLNIREFVVVLALQFG